MRCEAFPSYRAASCEVVCVFFFCGVVLSLLVLSLLVAPCVRCECDIMCSDCGCLVAIYRGLWLVRRRDWSEDANLCESEWMGTRRVAIWHLRSYHLGRTVPRYCAVRHPVRRSAFGAFTLVIS